MDYQRDSEVFVAGKFIPDWAQFSDAPLLSGKVTGQHSGETLLQGV